MHLSKCRKVLFHYWSYRTDRYGYTRTFKVYEWEDCSYYSLHPQCTKAKETTRKFIITKNGKTKKPIQGRSFRKKNRRNLRFNVKSIWNLFFGFLKANLRFTRFSVRGKERVDNELGFAFMAVNLRKYTAMKASPSLNGSHHPNQKESLHLFLMKGFLFKLF
ncbi:transposase [Virgibacillus sp. NKC19-3]|uniref:transposase n=1 Tax=Virgibacillus saliphilus TaxID=2831674 RepID=UPI001C9A4B94|nr:transposase [Virgibacillus sp. NKC19-3]